ncbi:MAG: immunoglobulin-like domain-containing protein, partial [Ruminococcus sp.]
MGTAEIYISSMISPNEKSLKMERYYNARANNAISGDLTANQWYHIDVVYTNNATVVYVDGTQVSYESSSFKLTDILGTGSIFQIGKGNWGSGEYTTMQLDNFKIVAGARRYTNQLEWLADQLTLPYSTETGKEVYGNITLPATISEEGLSATVTWETKNSAVVSAGGIVNRPASDTDVTLTATITSGSSTTKRDFTFTVKAKPKEIKEEDYTDYFFAYFTGEAYSNGEQAYFATSQDGLKWENINNNKPSLSSTVGRTGLRDPFIIRSPEGDKFYMLATDANHNKYGWETFSTSVFIAESTDLVNWTNQRLVDLGQNSQGNSYGFKCVWAPEAFYDSSRGEYVVFWASSYVSPVSDGAKLKIFYATTRDFYTFSDAVTYIAYDVNNSYIDTTMIENNGTIYRFTKNEGAEGTTNSLGANGKSIFMEKGTNGVFGSFSYVSSASLNAEHPVEAPAIFKLNKDDAETDTWCLLLDNFSGIGYYPLLTTDLDSGVFEKVSADRYQMPGAGYRNARHGTPIRITSEEYKTIMANAAENTKTPAEGDITAEFNIDAVNVLDTDANTILIYPNKFATQDIDNKADHQLTLNEMFQTLPDGFNWSNWYAIRIENRGNKSDGLRYTVLQKDTASAGFAVQKNDSFFLLVKKTPENETLYNNIRDQWPTINSGVINEYVSDGLGDTAEIFINNNLELNDLNGEHGCNSGNPYGKVTFIRRNTFGIEAINTLDTHNDVNTILVNPAYFKSQIDTTYGGVKILRNMFPNPPSDFNWGAWTAVRIEKRGGRYTVLEEGVPVSGDQVGYIGVDTYDSYILLIRTALLDNFPSYKRPTADWPQPTTDYTLDGNGDTATFTFLNADNTYSSADTSGLKSGVSTADDITNFGSDRYDKYYAYVTFTPKNYEQRNGLNGEQGEKADADITPVTDSSIKFSLFDYDGNINFKRGTSQYTEANQRTIAEYFPFKYQLYGLWSNPEYQNIPSRSDNNLYWDTEYDKWNFIPGHSTVNKTLNLAGYPVLNLWRTDSDGNSFTTTPELNDEERS